MVPSDDELPVLAGRIADEYHQLLAIKNRYYAAKELEDELTRVCRGKEFTPRNQLIWETALDSYHMLVIALDDWATALWKQGGLFGQLKAHHLSEFRTKRPRDRNEDPDEAAANNEVYEAAFQRLFPSCTTDTAKPGDIEALAAKFKSRCGGLGEDRNENRAHPGHRRRTGSAAPALGIPELGDLFDDLESFLDDIALVGAHMSYGKPDLAWASAEETARDLADLILFGNLRTVTRQLERHGSRERIFDYMHARHDHGGFDCFNDVLFEVFAWGESRRGSRASDDPSR